MREVNREEFQNAYGSGFCITYRESAYAGRAIGLVCDAPLDERIDLVRGVGPKVREKLLADGYRTIAELARHPRFGPAAGRVFAALASRNVPELIRAGARDVELASLFGRDEFAVIDIETVGLWQVLPLFLIGIAVDVGGEWEIKQYFARSFEEEGAILHEAVRELAGRRVCVTYNGKAFDEPFVRARLGMHGVRPLKFRLHVDLLHSCRRTLGGVLPDCRLTTVGERVVGLSRIEDVPGSAVPDLYFQYIRDGDWGYVEPILRHNAWDLAALCRIVDASSLGTCAPLALHEAVEAHDDPPERGAG